MYPRTHRPLIVVGRPRAGTRFVTNVLNSFKEVAIQGEIPNPVMKAIVTMMDEADRYYESNAIKGDKRRKKQYERWLIKRKDLLFSFWENAGQAHRINANSKKMYFGYKRPNHEQYFDFYENAFLKKPPIYVFCVRNFVDNFLSISSRWPERTIQNVADEYLAALAQYQRMKTTAPNRVLLFNLDDHIRLGMKHIEDNLINPLQLHLTPEHKSSLSKKKGANRTEEDHKVPRRKSLTMLEESFLQENPELESAFQRLCSDDA